MGIGGESSGGLVGPDKHRQLFFEREREALHVALDVRKFEIELYWKRALYFWGFIATIATGYITVFFKEENSYKLYLLLFISGFGLIFSFGWYLVNRGSKYWQENWEAHVDLLEDDFLGPLYKSVIYTNKKKNLKYIFSASSRISVSKVNQIISLYVFVGWVILSFGCVVFDCKELSNINWLVFAFFCIIIFCLLMLMYKFSSSENYNKEFHCTTRSSSINNKK